MKAFWLLTSLAIGGLATVQAQSAPAPLPNQAVQPFGAASERSVSCGLTIFSGGNQPDPKISRQTPSGNFTMRLPKPTVCRDVSRRPALKDLEDLPNRLPTFLGPKR